jgi:hypothetical protein
MKQLEQLRLSARGAEVRDYVVISLLFVTKNKNGKLRTFTCDKDVEEARVPVPS